MKILASGLLLLATFFALSCDSETSTDRSKAGTNSHGTLPKFTLQQLDGSQIDFAQFSGKVLLVDFWAIWCKPCIDEIPAYNALHDKYSSANFALVAITMESGNASTIAQFAAQHDIEYPVFIGNAEAASAFGGLRGYPSTFVLDQNGQIRKSYIGGGRAKNEEIDALVQELLNEAS
ncbi:TlpA family protein disulfide reductase [candidate division KSB1 bacterium]|nr:TlpA family protein disulfide reductase [candidate division KSB1 bacterium]TDI87788.1 MAG: TlpA family protein disulfide reductase [Caldithrix sp.]